MVTNDFLLHLRLLSSTTFSHYSSNNLPSFRSVYRPDPPDRPQSTAGIEKKCTAGERLQDWIVTRTSLAASTSSNHFHFHFLFFLGRFFFVLVLFLR